jgi:tRNA1(Val) A37 N6-methylase TrmN6
MSQNPEIHVLDHKVRLIQAEKGFRTSLDSVFLASACPAGEGDRVLDMGCGVGGASFCLLWRVPQTYVTGVDIQPDHVDLALGNIALNSMEGRAGFVCVDIRNFRQENRFDHVICNPPYLEDGSYTPSPSTQRATALGHHGTDVTLQDWLDAGFHNLKSGGSLTMIHRADMTDKIIQGLGRRFGAIEIIPLWPRAGQEAKRVIIRALKDRKTPARLHSGIILHEDDGRYTQEADAVLRDGAAID